MTKFKSFVIFLAGVACGSAATYQYTKRKYDQIAQDEIESVKEAFSKKTDKPKKEINDADPAPIFINKNYINAQRTEAKVVKRPYVIPPEEFGSHADYEQISLTYYADQVLTDENDELVEDVNDIVGIESLTHFGEYEDDSVFVRNDYLRCDYEILMDQRTYSEILRARPHRMEV